MDEEGYIRSCFEVNPSTGIITWSQDRPLSHFKRPRDIKRYEGKVGKPVGGKVQHANNTYLQVRLLGKKYFCHRIAWLLYYGVWPEGVIDHLDGDGLNNAKDNLRDTSQEVNMKNCRIRSDSTSGTCGVSFNKEKGLWEAYGTVSQKKKNLGYFPSKDEAASARMSWQLENQFTERHGGCK